MPSLNVISPALSSPVRHGGSEPPPEPDQPPGLDGSSGLLIRAARLDDLDRLFDIEHACFDSDALSRRSFHHALTHAHATCLVETMDGQVAGYALVFERTNSRVAWLNSLAVDPAYRGRGIGRRLLGAAESSARRHGCHWMRLEVRPDNGSALALYRQEGYQLIATIPGFYEDGAPALRHRKNLLDDTSSASPVSQTSP